MIVAIATQTDQEDSPVAEIAGRAPFYLIFKDQKFDRVLKNPYQQERGAGPGVANLLTQAEVNLVISGQFGPLMINALERAGIKYQVSPGLTAKKALQQI